MSCRIRIFRVRATTYVKYTTYIYIYTPYARIHPVIPGLIHEDNKGSIIYLENWASYWPRPVWHVIPETENVCLIRWLRGEKRGIKEGWDGWKIDGAGVEWSSRQERQRKVGGGKFRGPKRKDSLLPFSTFPKTPASFRGVNVCNLATVAPCNWDPARAMMLAARMDDFVQRPPSLRPRESPRLDSHG